MVGLGVAVPEAGLRAREDLELLGRVLRVARPVRPLVTARVVVAQASSVQTQAATMPVLVVRVWQVPSLERL
jgi:hypothetical protein